MSRLVGFGKYRPAQIATRTQGDQSPHRRQTEPRPRQRKAQSATPGQNRWQPNSGFSDNCHKSSPRRQACSPKACHGHTERERGRERDRRIMMYWWKPGVAVTKPKACHGSGGRGSRGTFAAVTLTPATRRRGDNRSVDKRRTSPNGSHPLDRRDRARRGGGPHAPADRAVHAGVWSGPVVALVRAVREDETTRHMAWSLALAGPESRVAFPPLGPPGRPSRSAGGSWSLRASGGRDGACRSDSRLARAWS